MDGQCQPYSDFTQNTLTLPFDNIQFTAMETQFEQYNFNTQTLTNFTTTCSDGVSLKGIINALQNGQNFVTNCDGNSWRVFTCEKKRIFCVNCKQNCVSTVICPGSDAGSGSENVFNPCSSCRTHATAAALMNVQYVVHKIYPQFVLPMNVTPGEYEFKVSVNVSKPGESVNMIVILFLL